MRLGRKKLVLLTAIAVILVLVIFTITERRESVVGPSYQGKSLSEWLERIEIHSHADRNSADFLQTSNAIVQIGTNGLPHLIKWISYEPSRPYALFWSAIIRGTEMLPSRLLPETVLHWVFTSGGFHRAEAATTAFEILGPSAKSSVVELYSLVKNSNQLRVSGRVTIALTYLGPAAYPFLLEIASDINAPTRRTAVGALGRMGTSAISAVPMLIQALDDPDNDISMTSSYVLGDLGLSPVTVVPALTNALRHPFEMTRIGAARSLALFGTDAIIAIPALRVALGDSDSYVREKASNALEVITAASQTGNNSE